MLRTANMNLGEKRKNEESAHVEAIGYKSSVEIYLMKDYEHSKGNIA